MTRRKSAAGLLALAGCLVVPATMVLADGSIKGSTKFDGEMRNQRPIRVIGDAFCITRHKNDPLPKENFVFNKEKGTLTNVLVYVSKGVPTGPFDPPSEPAHIEQNGCRYVPHMTALQTGQTLEIKNTDSTSHNLNLLAQKNPGFNVGQAMVGMVHEVKFANPEFDSPMFLKCDVHSWMGAYIAVFDHPFFAISDKNGDFEISSLPPGKYTVKVWHEFDKFTPVNGEIEVEVKDGEATQVDFTYKPPG